MFSRCPSADQSGFIFHFAHPPGRIRFDSNFRAIYTTNLVRPVNKPLKSANFPSSGPCCCLNDGWPNNKFCKRLEGLLKSSQPLNLASVCTTAYKREAGKKVGPWLLEKVGRAIQGNFIGKLFSSILPKDCPNLLGGVLEDKIL